MPKKGEKHHQETLQKTRKNPKGRSVWNKGRHWSDLEKVRIGICTRGTFNWIDKEILREKAIRDYAIAQICEEKKLFKPAIILYAGLLEALLIYKMDSEYEKEDFEKLIDGAREQGLIKQGDADRMQMMRHFRNYVHIYKEVSENFTLNNGITETARELCNSVIETLRNTKS